MLLETSDPRQDELTLRDTLRLLMDYPGNDPVLLEVRTNGKTVRLEASMKGQRLPRTVRAAGGYPRRGHGA